jgi:hypothetical protein
VKKLRVLVEPEVSFFAQAGYEAEAPISRTWSLAFFVRIAKKPVLSPRF